MDDEADRKDIEGMLDDPAMVEALRSEDFRQILDHIPVAIAVSEMQPSEHLVYANEEFERLAGLDFDRIEGRTWTDLAPLAEMGERVTSSDDQDDDYIGSGELVPADGTDRAGLFDWWANVILDDDGTPLFRIVAAARSADHDREEAIRQIRDKETQLRELQHRVTNNLQMITALIRIEARNLPTDAPEAPFVRLAGRVGSLAVLYRLLSDAGPEASVDLGSYLSQIAATVMEAHATEGLRLDLKVDTWSVSVNVAMPTGLLVNEVMTNSLKHAFKGRESGTITLHSLVGADGCEITIADDGNGLADGEEWPCQGKLSDLIVRSLKANAEADLHVTSRSGEGVCVKIRFRRADA